MITDFQKKQVDEALDCLIPAISDLNSRAKHIAVALLFKHIDELDLDYEKKEGKRKYFSGYFADYAWSTILSQSKLGFNMFCIYCEAIQKMDFNKSIPSEYRHFFKSAYLPYFNSKTFSELLNITDKFKVRQTETIAGILDYLLSLSEIQFLIRQIKREYPLILWFN